MDIVVTGRNVEVPEHYRAKVADKLDRLERYDSKIVRAEIELAHETNRRQAKVCQKVEITLVTKGPAVRAEGKGENFYAALEKAVDKLETRARRAADRRHDKQHERTPISAMVAPDEALLALPETSSVDESADHRDHSAFSDELDDSDFAQGADGGPGRVVRVKDHPAEPITVDQALFQMELVGHDFYLFNDADTSLPTVVYRRHGFDYGLLRLS
ncbi:ribosome-associated translation inhibitor RaiA [Nakamurella antarctica]|uniref:Ribosome hibernation promoting factor n=1 Tax=Nakamurella antarctica TaxID=1902245 RepID=A0A3G8ZJN8_9ACTN|nr:ribosome-associated translation inhibitor RaiA [Nakamurella antarctica]AZI57483.1 ribosome-associated translation inhibitor RaiA [Nakamurella antarctica]